MDVEEMEFPSILKTAISYLRWVHSRSTSQA